MRALFLLCLIPLVAVSFAGCVVGPTEAFEARPVKLEAVPTETTGSVHGLVMDEENRPLPGVMVGILEPGLTTLSDTSGIFVFNGLLEGSYRLVAERIGYGSVAQEIQVYLGMVAEVTVELAPRPFGTDPFFVAWPEDGFVACSFNPFWPTNPCSFLGSGDRSKIPFQIEEEPQVGEVVLELVWQSATMASGRELEIDVCDEQPPSSNHLNCFNADHYWAWESGPSPVVLRLDDLPVRDVDRYEADIGAGFPVETVPPGATSLMPAYQQAFTLYITYCFVEACPPDYAARPA